MVLNYMIMIWYGEYFTKRGEERPLGSHLALMKKMRSSCV
jgi:hypothetical protein